MKLKKITFFLIMVIAAAITACSKQELLQPNPAKVIQLNVTGSTIADLEYIYKDSVVATSIGGTGGINVKTLLAVSGDKGEIRIRKKGSTEIIATKTVTPSPFNQNTSIYYDGTKVYTGAVSLRIKGYASAGELEFLLGGNVLYSGTGVIDQGNLSVLIDNNATRDVLVRKKGETAILLTKTITATPAAQSLNFFFDGTSIVDNVKLNPPANPANMFISAKFQTTYSDYFKKVDVDVVFFERNIATGVAVKTNPEIRLTLPASGSFNNIELPPLSNPATNAYSFDIYEKGTSTVPYTTTGAPFILAIYPFQQNLGRIGSTISFEAGKSKLLLIQDSKIIKPNPPRSTMLSGGIIDLSQYFQ